METVLSGVVVATTILSLFELLLIIALARQIGVLHVAIEGPSSGPEGLPLGSDFPDFETASVDGPLTNAREVIQEKKSAVLFVTSACGGCANILDELDDSSESWRRDGGLVVVIGEPGMIIDRPDWPVGDGIRVLRQNDYAGQIAVRAPQLPWLTVVDEKGVVVGQGRVADRVSLEALLN